MPGVSLPQLGHDQPFSKPVSLGLAYSLNTTGGSSVFSLNWTISRGEPGMCVALAPCPAIAVMVI